MTPQRVSEKAAALRLALGRRVAEELEYAGLPVSLAESDNGPSERPGAVVTVNQLDDECALTVRWRASRAAHDRGVELLLAGETDHAFRRRFDGHLYAMQIALHSILRAGGFEVSTSANQYAPYALDVAHHSCLGGIVDIEAI